MSEIIRKDSIEEIALKRARCLELFERGFGLIADAMALHREVARTDYGPESDLQKDYAWNAIADGKRDRAQGIARRRVDRDVWKYLFEASGLRDLMDATAIEDWRRELERDPPPADIDTIRATFTRLRDERGAIFRRGAVRLFEQLDRKRFRSHSAFKIEARIILESAFQENDSGWNHWRDGREKLADLDRIMHVLDGRQPKASGGDAAAMVAQDRRSRLSGDVETDYLRLRHFQNGNVHAWMKRADLVAAVNRLIAEERGAVIPAERAA